MDAQTFFGYETREPYPDELKYFRNNPAVSGMATEDGRIIFNPFSQGVNRESVGRNEAARLWLRQNKVDPSFDMTQKQQSFFVGTPYEKDSLSAKHSILGRIISGDNSAMDITENQRKWADWLMYQLNSRNKK